LKPTEIRLCWRERPGSESA